MHKHIEKVKKVFASNPSIDEFHVTSDGQCFFTKHDATYHGGRLGNTVEARNVEVIKRSELPEDKKGGKGKPEDGE